MPASSNVQLLVLERREPAANVARFYVLTIEETLFGDTALVREWGRLGTSGRRRLDLFEERAQASEALENWLGRKLRRGYQARPARASSLGSRLTAASCCTRRDDTPQSSWLGTRKRPADRPDHLFIERPGLPGMATVLVR